jgi:hypothetical protein
MSVLFRSSILTGFVVQVALWAAAIRADGALSRLFASAAAAQPFLLMFAVTASFFAAVAEPRREPYLRATGGLLAGTALFFFTLIGLFFFLTTLGIGFAFAPPV